jgi:hypothetical protein
MWLDDETLSAPLGLLGIPRVLEIAVLMSATRHSYAAGRAVVASFARARGAIPGKLAMTSTSNQHRKYQDAETVA